MMDTYFYCQNCDEKITIEQLALLNEGKCPKCRSIEGFSTIPKDENDSFEQVTVLNDTEFMNR